MTRDDGGYAAVIRQAVHDAVHALLTAPPDSLAGLRALREVTMPLAAEHGAAAVTDLAEELAADLAEAFEALAAAEGRSALVSLRAGSTTSPHRSRRPLRPPTSQGSRRPTAARTARSATETARRDWRSNGTAACGVPEVGTGL